jgi:triphosphoribosyl-dephospho-CoA synthase
MNADYIAQCAQLAMLIELSSSPKPGNVDRCHDHDDTRFQHFLASAVSVYPIFDRAAYGDERIGSLLLDAVLAWKNWHLGGNTHFGSLVLLIPLASAAGRSGPLRKELCDIINSSSVEDAVDFYEAFRLAGARVAEVNDFDLKCSGSKEEVQSCNKTLLDLMKLSENHDLIAKEWARCFERSFSLSDLLMENVLQYGINDGVVLTYFEALSQEPDSLVQAKFGIDKAIEVSERAGAIFREDLKDMPEFAKKLDHTFIEEGINPGSTADLISAALFIALLGGMRF